MYTLALANRTNFQTGVDSLRWRVDLDQITNLKQSLEISTTV